MSAIRRLGDINQTTGQAFEGEIREFIQRDVSMRRRAREAGGGNGVENVTNLIDRVSGASVEEIDRLIAQLQTMREMLHREGERVRRELTGYAGMSQSALTATKIIADTLAQFKPDPNLPQPRTDAG
jgi:phytoene/squalene synthetase